MGDSAAPADRDVIVLRVAEIFLKGKNRSRFFRALVRNTRRLLRGVEGVDIEAMYLRVVVHHPPALRALCVDRLRHLFGLASMALGTTVPTGSTDAVGALDAIAEEAAAALAATPAGASFKVETKRRDKRFPRTSEQVSREVGGRLVQRTGRPVDVHAPDHVIRVEIDPGQSFVFGAVVPGPGGLPVGTAGNAMLLLSGGIDSPVAGWSAMRRGCHVSAVYFHSFPYTGDKTKEKVLDLARRLAAWQGPVPMHVVHFTEAQKTLREHGRAELAVLLYRRLMMRAASILAERERCKALITGENLGQVASQTLDNLGVIEDAARLPVLRPLITFDKAEIVAQARRIGTYETSILPYEDCCALFVPKHPATRARPADLAAAERGLDLEAMAVALADGAELVIAR